MACCLPKAVIFQLLWLATQRNYAAMLEFYIKIKTYRGCEALKKEIMKIKYKLKRKGLQVGEAKGQESMTTPQRSVSGE